MDVVTILRRRLRGTLPGEVAHRQMMPDHPMMNNRLRPLPSTARPSAVLVPLIPTEHGMPKVMLTVRSEGLRRHGGQISFPGGRIEPNETAEQAALRELFEETGVGPEKVDVLGTLTPLYIPNSNSGVTPIVSVITEPMQYVPSEAEVEEIFTVDLAMFMLQANLGSITKEYSGTQVIWPVWNVHAHVPLWGATAMILNELIWLLRGDTDV